MDHILKDDRFKHIVKDPKFRRISRQHRKIKIDKRFQGMFKDKQFAVTYTVDKRGRPVNQTSAENLRKYYDYSSSEEESENEEAESKKSDVKPVREKKQAQKKSVDTTKEADANEEVEDEDKDEDEGEDSSLDNDFSSNGELLRIKAKEQCDQDSDVDSEQASKDDSDIEEYTEDTKADLDENEKQLEVREKGENMKVSDKIKEKLKDLSVNYARGEGVLMSDSSSDDESSEEELDDEIEHNWGELDKEAETTDEITPRLAVCNMDWDRIRALDLMVLFSSFLPSGGLIKSVTIYPSEFGIQRMKEEEVSGPIELTKVDSNTELENEDENEEGSEYHMEKLRQYQLNRLKYYYAVVEFDSAETANKVYTECDGIEYESTATKLDLRFIPDDMEFEQEPKEVCSEVPDLSKYQPRQFTTTALQQVKVELTWDETNPERQEFAQKINSAKLEDIKDSDLQTYLASDTSDNESEAEQQQDTDQEDDSDAGAAGDSIEKYKLLLKEIEEQEQAKQKKDVELEFSWGLGAEEKAEKLVKDRLKKDENLTPFEQYIEKRKAKRKAKREERKALKNDKNENDSDNSDLSGVEMDDEEKEINEKVTKGKKNLVGSSSGKDNEEHSKAELELLLMDENNDTNKQHFNMKKIEENATASKSKQKRLSKKKNSEAQQPQDNFEVNVQDPRFNALFTSHHYNIDPADPHYRKTKGTEALVKEKLKRRVTDDSTDTIEAKQPKKDTKLNVELQALVKSVKKNSKNIVQPINR